MGAHYTAGHDNDDLYQILPGDTLAEGKGKKQEGQGNDSPSGELAPPVTGYVFYRAHLQRSKNTFLYSEIQLIRIKSNCKGKSASVSPAFARVPFSDFSSKFAV